MVKKNKPDSDPPQYEERLVAFLDILGFKGLIEHTVTDTSTFEKVHGALSAIEAHHRGKHESITHTIASFSKHLDESKPDVKNIFDLWRSTDTRIVFSDSIVISHPLTIIMLDAVPSLLREVANLALTLLGLGIMVRGGIALGPLYHKDSVVFGPAMIDAYELESRYALYPRILISDAIAEWILSLHMPEPWEIPEFPRGNMEQDLEHTSYCMEVLRRDDDGLYYLDYLSARATSKGEWWINDNSDPSLQLLPIASFLTDELAREKNPRIREKLVWMARYFNATIKKRKLLYPKVRIR